jgi:hypothetical protein
MRESIVVRGLTRINTIYLLNRSNMALYIFALVLYSMKGVIKLSKAV